jgi:monofunctional biosynthetic peptidoglycan transglycosylase
MPAPKILPAPLWKKALRFARWLILPLFFLLGVLPALAWFVAPPSTLMWGRWLTGQAVERHAVPLERMGRIPQMVIAAEDARFCQHRGVDWVEMQKVVAATTMDGPARGASTIPMQTAKNLYLWPGRSYVRKGLEIPLAYWLSAVWSKRRMLEIYLNMAEWGDGIFGVEAAARRYFRKPASQLSRMEAALLITTLPDPLDRNPMRPGSGHRAMAAALTARAVREGTVDACTR